MFCSQRCQLILLSGHMISLLHSRSRFDAMVWNNNLLLVFTSLQSKGSALFSFSWRFNIEAKYTHMFVYQDAQVPTSFGLQSLRRKARFLLWQRWLGDEASMFMDTSLFGSSPPCILRFASTVSWIKFYALESFFWRFKKEDKLLSTGRTNFVGAAISSSVSRLWPEQSLKANNLEHVHQCPVNNWTFAICAFLWMHCRKGDVWLNIVLFVYPVVVCVCRLVVDQAYVITICIHIYLYVYTYIHIYVWQGKLCCFYCSLQII